MYCPNCGTQIPDDSIFCTSCGTRISTAASAAASPTASTPSSYTPPATTGMPPTQAAPQPGYVNLPRKDPAIAAILSFFLSGLGQMYVGKVGRGLAILVVQIILFFTIIGIIIGFFIWIWAIYDAYKLAERYNYFVQQNGRAPTSVDAW